jgi:hypothetical protein
MKINPTCYQTSRFASAFYVQACCCLYEYGGPFTSMSCLINCSIVSITLPNSSRRVIAKKRFASNVSKLRLIDLIPMRLSSAAYG